MQLVGRHQEIRRLTAAVDSVRESGSVIIVRGDPGIGKSALLAQAIQHAEDSGMRVLGTVGVQAEFHQSYSGLHQLLWPARDDLSVLPAIQQEAIRAALGLSDSRVPDGFLVGLGVLTLLAELATQRPVLVAVDDAQWLDASTVDVLAFLARRLESEPIVLIATEREGVPSGWDTVGLPELHVHALSPESAAALLDQRAVTLQSAIRQRVLDDAAGNPLALLELPDAVRNLEALADLDRHWLPLTGRLERAFTERLAGLPADTKTALQVAALNDSADVNETIAAASLISGQPLTVADLERAAAERLIELTDDTLAFRHPLIRSAIRHDAGDDRRRAICRALAEVTAADPDRRAWHLAGASEQPDEQIAAELEETAVRAQRRGSGTAAVSALEQAARLTPDPCRRADRLLRAADVCVELGKQEVVRRLLGEAAKLPLSGQQRAKAAWIRAAFDDGMRDVSTDAASLADLAAGVAADGDVDWAVRILWSAALRCFWTEPGAAARRHIVDVAEVLPLDPLDARLLAILGYAAPIDRGTVVIERSEQLLQQPLLDPQADRLIGSASVLVGAFDIAISQSDASLDGLREQGRLQLLARALAAQAWSAVHLMDLAVAIPAATEARELAEETGQPFLRALVVATQAKLAALRGDLDEATALATEAESGGAPVGARPVMATAQHARALAALSIGDHEQALVRLLRMHDPADTSYQLALRCHTIADLAEAAARSGRPEAAKAAMTGMEDAATKTISPSLHGGLRLARATLAADAYADDLFRTALRADLTCQPLMRARTELAYGEWLRRQRRTTDARRALRSARDTFDALGAIPWGQRARNELRAAGEVSRPRETTATDQLTPQEYQIALLAAEGLTNREIGQRLYISHRTVGGHLARIFPKLGISSRAGLHRALNP